MFQVQIPAGTAPGDTIQAQSPYGNTIQVQAIQVQAIQVSDPMAANTIGAPAQQMMHMAGGDIFQGKTRLFIKQEMAMIELCGVEAKQRYRISVPNADGKEGQVFLYITEESDCCERVMCGPNRSLKLKVHNGPTKDGPVIMEMKKPFTCQGCCFLRPSFEVSSSGQKIGNIEDPCRCCLMDQQVFGKNNRLLFQTAGSICQPGICCPICASVNFDVTKNGQRVGKVEKMPMDCEECFAHTNRFTVHFDKITDPEEKKMLLASAMLLDLEYFESQK